MDGIGTTSLQLRKNCKATNCILEKKALQLFILYTYSWVGKGNQNAQRKQAQKWSTDHANDAECRLQK